MSVGHVRLFATPWTVVRQPTLPMGFSRQKCRSGLPCPPPGDLPSPGIEMGSPALQADSLPAEVLDGDGSKASAPSEEMVSKVSPVFFFFFFSFLFYTRVKRLTML